MLEAFRTKQNFVLIGVALLIYSLVTLIFFLTRGDTVEVELIVAPTQAVIKIDDREVRQGKIYLRPGEYTLSAELEGFSSYSRQFVAAINEPLLFTVSLQPITDAAWEIVLDDPKYLEIEAITGVRSLEETNTLIKANPIVGHLPHRDFIFNIDYKFNESNQLVVVISADDDVGIATALSVIASWGIDADSLIIEYAEFTNP